MHEEHELCFGMNEASARPIPVVQLVAKLFHNRDELVPGEVRWLGLEPCYRFGCLAHTSCDTKTATCVATTFSCTIALRPSVISRMTAVQFSPFATKAPNLQEKGGDASQSFWSAQVRSQRLTEKLAVKAKFLRGWSTGSGSNRRILVLQTSALATSPPVLKRDGAGRRTGTQEFWLPDPLPNPCSIYCGCAVVRR